MEMTKRLQRAGRPVWFGSAHRHLLTGCLLGLLLTAAAPAASLRLEGDRAWLDAEGVPLVNILRLFEQRGVEVMIDPSLDLGRVSGEWENTRVDRLIGQLVSPHSYLLERRKMSGPLGDVYRLASIRIYAGNPASARPLSAAKRVLDVVEGESGVRYIRGEIMVGFREGSSVDDLKALLEAVDGTLIEVIDPPGIYRIRLNEGMTVERAMEIANANEQVEVSEPNLAFPRLGTMPQDFAGGGNPINLQLRPGETAVAVFDSGLDPQYADLSVIRGTYDAIDPSADISDPLGHGTLSTLVAAGVITPEGAVPAENGVPVLSIRTFDENGMTSSDTLMRALQYAADSGVKIINMSWGSEVDSTFMETAMNYAAENGMTLFASAGNEPTGTAIYPAGYEAVIAVGGLNPDGSRWANSNFGDFVDLYEPAIAVFNGKTFAGTSISSPYAAFRAAQK
jgi:hypothetical protein